VETWWVVVSRGKESGEKEGICHAWACSSRRGGDDEGLGSSPTALAGCIHATAMSAAARLVTMFFLASRLRMDPAFKGIFMCVTFWGVCSRYARRGFF